MTSEWQVGQLRDFALINPKTASLSSSSPFITMSDVPVKGQWANPTSEKGTRGGIRAQGGDVLIARITPCLENGKIAKVPSEYAAVGGSTEFIVLRGTEQVCSEFLFLWARERKNHSSAVDLMIGSTGRQRVSANDYSSLPMRVPPKDEQRRIVDLVGAVDDAIDAAESLRASLTEVKTNITNSLLERAALSSPSVRLADVVALDLRKVSLLSGAAYPLAGVLNRGRGLLLREPATTESTKYAQLYKVLPGQIVYSKLKAFEGAITVASRDLDERYASNEFPTFTCSDALLPDYFRIRTTQSAFWEQLAQLSKGMGGRRERLNPGDFLTVELSLPSLREQSEAVAAYTAIEESIEKASDELTALLDLRDEILTTLLSGAHRIPETYDELMGA